MSKRPKVCKPAKVWHACSRSGSNISSGSTAKCAGGMALQSRVLSGSFRPMRPMRVPVASGRPTGSVTSVHLTETCGEEDAVHLIVQAEISAATEQDVEETMPLLRDVQARDLLPEVRLVDSGYVSGEVLAKHAELGIELVGPLKQEGGWQHETGYGVSAFQVDWDKQQVRCPQGHLSQHWCPGRHNRGAGVFWVRFSAVTCQACPVKELCTKREKNKGRILTLSPQSIHEARSRRRTEQSTPAFQQRYGLRAGIEGTISEGVRSHGLRRAHYRGQSKTQLQAKAIAAAINLVRIRQMLQRTRLGLSPRPKRSLSPFARLRSLLVA